MGLPRSNESRTPTPTQKTPTQNRISPDWPSALCVGGQKKRIFTHQACISFLKIPKDIPVLYFCKNKTKNK